MKQTLCSWLKSGTSKLRNISNIQNSLSFELWQNKILSTQNDRGSSFIRYKLVKMINFAFIEMEINFYFDLCMIHIENLKIEFAICREKMRIERFIIAKCHSNKWDVDTYSRHINCSLYPFLGYYNKMFWIFSLVGVFEHHHRHQKWQRNVNKL